MSFNDHTDMGGEGKVFQMTHWTELMQIQAENNDCERQQKLGQLLVNYWKPVYCYLRHKGHNSEDAKDLTQGFFQEIIIGGQLIRRAHKTKGKFRTFLLTSLDHYVSNKHYYETAKKRSPAHGLIPLDAFDPSSITDPAQNISPDDAFNYAWASELLRTVYGDVENLCRQSGKSVHWEVFRKKVLDPILDNAPAPSLKTICGELDVEDETRASNMIGTVKRIFRSSLNRHLKHLVHTDEDVDEEFNELMKIFSGK